MHLANCEACRRELGEVQVLRGGLREAYEHAEAPSANLRRAVMTRLAERAPRLTLLDRIAGSARGLLQPKWAPSLLVLLLVAQFGALTWLLLPHGAQPITRGLGPAHARLQIVFRASTPESSVQQTLRDLGARIVDGPDSAGGWIIELSGAVPAPQVARRLRELQEPSGSVERVEPIP